MVLSTNFAGSHLLSHLVSAHPACLGVGELHRYSQLLDGDEKAPVVAEYAANPLYAGLDELPVAHWHAQIGRRVGGNLPVVIVDNSKKVKWFNLIRKNPDYEIVLVHLLRDPRALVMRWLNTYTSAGSRRTQRLRVARRMPEHSLKIMFGSWETVFLYKWLRENLQIARCLEASGCDFIRVTYRDMAFAAERTLQRLMPALGLAFDPVQLRFGESETLGTIKTQHKDTVRRSEIKPDLLWRDQVSASALLEIESNKTLQGYLHSVGLELVQDGLTAER